MKEVTELSGIIIIWFQLYIENNKTVEKEDDI